MARIPLIAERSDDLTPEQLELFDNVVETRGKMIRPFEVLLNSPAVARHIADLGAQIRYGSEISDHHRELVIIATGAAHGCDFVWESHLPLAQAAGVGDATIAHLQGDDLSDPPEIDGVLIEFVNQLCRGSAVSESAFSHVQSHFGDSGVVELAAIVGYYTMMGYVMAAAGAC